MNVSNINKLIVHLQKVQAAGHFDAFRMDGWFTDTTPNSNLFTPEYETKSQTETPHNECGVVACIAGHAAICMAGEGIEIADIQTDAWHWLGLDYNEHIKLFLPVHKVPYENISIADAIQVLETFRDTGSIEWGFIDQRALELGQV